MARCVINGRVITHDKPGGIRVNGSRVSFQDGSWCDTATGEVYDREPRSIVLEPNGDQTVNEEPVEKTQTFVASALELRKLTGDVEVVLHRGPDLECTLTGPSSWVEAVMLDVEDGTLKIRGGQTPGGGVTIIGDDIYVSGSAITGSVITGSVTTVSSIGRKSTFGRLLDGIFGDDQDSVSISSISTGSQLRGKITIKVPSGTPVTSHKVDGNVNIGDILAPVQVVNDDRYPTTIGHVTSAVLKTTDRGGIIVAGVDGPVSVETQGSGSIAVKSGRANNLKAKCTDRGGVSLSVTAENADLKTTGSGSITLECANGEVRLDIDDRGGINVRGGRITTLTAANDGSGSILVDAEVQSANLKITDRGGITVAAIRGSATIKSTGSGGVLVKSGRIVSLTAKSTDRGGITVRAHAATADLRSSGSGNIVVQSVERVLKRSETDRGRILIDRIGPA